MKKVLSLFFLLSVIVLIAGCSGVQPVNDALEESSSGTVETADAQSDDSAVSDSISEADSIDSIEDSDAEKELDDIGSSLEDW